MEHRISAELQVVQGERETYLRSRELIRGHTLEIFVYEDEAGFFWNDEWNICEEQDFDQDSEIIECLLARLSARIRDHD
jgi:hypothetical protein